MIAINILAKKQLKTTLPVMHDANATSGVYR